MTTQKIMPGDMYVVEYGAVIRTRCLKELITDAMVHERVVAANLAPGDFVKVQCLNHERDAVLHYAEWLVISRKVEMRQVEATDYSTKHAEVGTFSVIQTAPWAATGLAGNSPEPAVETKAAKRAA